MILGKKCTGYKMSQEKMGKNVPGTKCPKCPTPQKRTAPN